MEEWEITLNSSLSQRGSTFRFAEMDHRRGSYLALRDALEANETSYSRGHATIQVSSHVELHRRESHALHCVRVFCTRQSLVKERVLAKVNTAFLDIRQGKRTCVLTKLPARFLSNISYVAVRGRDAEQGAVQRILNPSRIGRIRDFTLQGGDFPNAIVLNWTHKRRKLIRADGKLSISDDMKSAQIVDGQHRMAGIAAAIAIRDEIGDLELPVVFYEYLDTEACADIFLAINTEQKPVPRSLVFDLYGVTSSGLIDSAALRARDIAMYLNDEPTSPYFGEVKLPGSPIRMGGIPLSSVVTAIKPIVADQGVLDQVGIQELEFQKKVIHNYFDALRRRYGKEWSSRANAFMFSSGFVAAMNFFSLRVAPYCGVARSFQTDTIFDAIQLSDQSLIRQADVKGAGGQVAAKEIFDRLGAVFKSAGKASGPIKV